MTWIETITYKDSKGRLRKIYDGVKTSDGHIDNILSAHSLRPRTLDGHLSLYKATLHSKPNELSNRERELIGVCVSATNKCGYCVDHHTVGLGKHIKSQKIAEELAQASIGVIDSKHFTEKDKVLCRYAIKLTKFPGEMRETDLISLKEVGLTDAGILDLNQIVAYFAYANRTVLGLGITTKGDTLGLHPTEDEIGFSHK